MHYTRAFYGDILRFFRERLSEMHKNLIGFLPIMTNLARISKNNATQ